MTNKLISNLLWEDVKKSVDKCNQKEKEYLEAEKEFQEVYKAYKDSLTY